MNNLKIFFQIFLGRICGGGGGGGGKVRKAGVGHSTLFNCVVDTVKLNGISQWIKENNLLLRLSLLFVMNAFRIRKVKDTFISFHVILAVLIYFLFLPADYKNFLGLCHAYLNFFWITYFKTVHLN